MGLFFNAFVVLPLSTVLVLMFAPGIPPYEVEYGPTKFVRRPLEGQLALNEKFKHAEILPSVVRGGTRLGAFQGPEGLAFKDGYIYTGIMGGEIVRMDLEKREEWEVFFRSGEDCKALHEEHKCGHPLGLRFDARGRLIVADGIKGIYRISADGKEEEILVPNGQIVDGRPVKFTNGVALATDGAIYYTSVSSRWSISDGLLVALSGPTGRVLRYDPKRKISEVLVDRVSFANGIELSHKEDFLLYTESGTGLVWKYHLKNSKNGRIGLREVFLRAPGLVDNIRRTGKGGFLVAVPMVIEEGFNPAVDVLFKYPFVQRFLSRLIYALGRLPEIIDEYCYPSPRLREFAYWTRNVGHERQSEMPKKFVIVEVDSEGKVINSWHGRDGDLGDGEDALLGASEGAFYKGHLYVGGPSNLAVARLPDK